MTQISTTPESMLASAVDNDRSVLSDYITLAKLRITAMVTLTTALGFAVGVAAMNSVTDWLTLIFACIGTAMSCMGAGVFNQVFERRTDAMMRRTQDRPLAAGRVQPLHAWLYGSALSVGGVAMLWWLATPLAAVLAAFTIVSYTWVYTPMKRVTSLATLVGAVPGALPPVIGYAAATNAVQVPAWCIFAVMFLWQLPHFLAIAWMYREDYGRAGFPLLPVLDPTGGSTFRQMLIGCLTLLPLSLLPTLLGVTGLLYFIAALLCGLGFLASAVVLVAKPSEARARGVFFASLLYLPIVLLAMAVDLV